MKWFATPLEAKRNMGRDKPQASAAPLYTTLFSPPSYNKAMKHINTSPIGLESCFTRLASCPSECGTCMRTFIPEKVASLPLKALYRPKPYKFRTSVPITCREATTAYVKVPPFWLLLDHTIAVLCILVSGVQRSLSTSQLHWALTCLKRIKQPDDRYSETIFESINLIEKELGLFRCSAQQTNQDRTNKLPFTMPSLHSDAKTMQENVVQKSIGVDTSDITFVFCKQCAENEKSRKDYSLNQGDNRNSKNVHPCCKNQSEETRSFKCHEGHGNIFNPGSVPFCQECHYHVHRSQPSEGMSYQSFIGDGSVVEAPFLEVPVQSSESGITIPSDDFRESPQTEQFLYSEARESAFIISQEVSIGNISCGSAQIITAIFSPSNSHILPTSQTGVTITEIDMSSDSSEKAIRGKDSQDNKTFTVFAPSLETTSRQGDFEIDISASNLLNIPSSSYISNEILPKISPSFTLDSDLGSFPSTTTILDEKSDFSSQSSGSDSGTLTNNSSMEITEKFSYGEFSNPSTCNEGRQSLSSSTILTTLPPVPKRRKTVENYSSNTSVEDELTTSESSRKAPLRLPSNFESVSRLPTKIEKLNTNYREATDIDLTNETVPGELAGAESVKETSALMSSNFESDSKCPTKPLELNNEMFKTELYASKQCGDGDTIVLNSSSLSENSVTNIFDDSSTTSIKGDCEVSKKHTTFPSDTHTLKVNDGAVVHLKEHTKNLETTADLSSTNETKSPSDYIQTTDHTKKDSKEAEGRYLFNNSQSKNNLSCIDTGTNNEQSKLELEIEPFLLVEKTNSRTSNSAESLKSLSRMTRAKLYEIISNHYLSKEADSMNDVRTSEYEKSSKKDLFKDTLSESSSRDQRQYENAPPSDISLKSNNDNEANKEATAYVVKRTKFGTEILATCRTPSNNTIPVIEGMEAINANNKGRKLWIVKEKDIGTLKTDNKSHNDEKHSTNKVRPSTYNLDEDYRTEIKTGRSLSAPETISSDRLVDKNIRSSSLQRATGPSNNKNSLSRSNISETLEKKNASKDYTNVSFSAKPVTVNSTGVRSQIELSQKIDFSSSSRKNIKVPITTETQSMLETRETIPYNSILNKKHEESIRSKTYVTVAGTSLNKSTKYKESVSKNSTHKRLLIKKGANVQLSEKTSENSSDKRSLLKKGRNAQLAEKTFEHSTEERSLLKNGENVQLAEKTSAHSTEKRRLIKKGANVQLAEKTSEHSTEKISLLKKGPNVQLAEKTFENSTDKTSLLKKGANVQLAEKTGTLNSATITSKTERRITPKPTDSPTSSPVARKRSYNLRNKESSTSSENMSSYYNLNKVKQLETKNKSLVNSMPIPKTTSVKLEKGPCENTITRNRFISQLKLKRQLSPIKEVNSSTSTISNSKGKLNSSQNDKETSNDNSNINRKEMPCSENTSNRQSNDSIDTKKTDVDHDVVNCDTETMDEASVERKLSSCLVLQRKLVTDDETKVLIENRAKTSASVLLPTKIDDECKEPVVNTKHPKKVSKRNVIGVVKPAIESTGSNTKSVQQEMKTRLIPKPNAKVTANLIKNKERNLSASPSIKTTGKTSASASVRSSIVFNKAEKPDLPINVNNIRAEGAKTILGVVNSATENNTSSPKGTQHLKRRFLTTKANQNKTSRNLTTVKIKDVSTSPKSTGNTHQLSLVEGRIANSTTTSKQEKPELLKEGTNTGRGSYESRSPPEILSHSPDECNNSKTEKGTTSPQEIN